MLIIVDEDRLRAALDRTVRTARTADELPDEIVDRELDELRPSDDRLLRFIGAVVSGSGVDPSDDPAGYLIRVWENL